MIEEADWIDPVRLEERVAGMVARNRERLAKRVRLALSDRKDDA